MALAILAVLADVTGVLGYFGINPPPILRPDQIVLSATVSVQSDDEIRTKPTWNKCRHPNLRDLIPVEDALSIVKTIYTDMNSDGEPEAIVLSEAENSTSTYFDVMTCDPVPKTWKNAIHEQFAKPT